MRYGKPIKNKKRIDPRYFLNEGRVESVEPAENVYIVTLQSGEKIMAEIEHIGHEVYDVKLYDSVDMEIDDPKGVLADEIVNFMEEDYIV